MEITPYPNNSKKHPDKQLKLIAESIRQFGWQQPIKVGQDNVIIVGHGRWEAYQKYGDGLKPAWIVDKDGKTISGEAETRQLTPAEEKAYRLADNKINESDWEMDKVIDELKELDEEGFDIGVTGFDYDLLLDPEDKDDEIPETPETPRSQLGDLYELKNHRVLCGDSTKTDDLVKLMDGRMADMVHTDPPYGMKLNTDWSDVRGGKYSEVIGDDKEFDPRPFFEYFDKVKEQFWWGADYYSRSLPYDVGSWLVWDKRSEEGFESSGDPDAMIGSMFELCWTKNKHRREIVRFRWAGSYGLWQDDTDGRVHPTQKPAGMVEKILQKYGKSGDIVADLFLGSGSTLIASEKTGRICYGMELDPKYVDVIIQRYVNYTGNTEVKKNGKVEKWYITTQND